MLKALGFVVGNLLAGWVLARMLGSQLHYPPEIPLRLQPQLPAFIMATVFSLFGLPLGRLHPKLRTPFLILTMPLSIAAAGAICMPFGRLDGALMGLVIAQNSPLAVMAGAGWGLIWSFITFPPIKPVTPRPAAPPREELPISDQWSGSER